MHINLDFLFYIEIYWKNTTKKIVKFIIRPEKIKINIKKTA